METPPIGVSILTHAGRGQHLIRCVKSLLANTAYQHEDLTVAIFQNGGTEDDAVALDEVLDCCRACNISVRHEVSPVDLGCSVGTNRALSMVRDFEYAIHIESDFELIPNVWSGVDFLWLRRAMEWIQGSTCDYLYLRRMTGPQEMRAHWWAQWQARLKGDGEYLSCPGFWWSNNPALRKNKALYEQGVLPIPEEAGEHKGTPQWGRPELQTKAPANPYLHRYGMFIHDPQTQPNYEKGTGCEKYPAVGVSTCKYHFFMRPGHPFCLTCDHSKGREDMADHADRDLKRTYPPPAYPVKILTATPTPTTEGEPVSIHPVVLVMGVNAPVELHTPGQIGPFETDKLTVHCKPGDEDLSVDLARYRPHVIVTVGKGEDFPNMQAASWAVRRKWLHVDSLATEQEREQLGVKVVLCLLGASLDPMAGGAGLPLISVVTPTYNAAKLINVPYVSLLNQTYKNWEWVIIDDSPDDKTCEVIQDFEKTDHRIRLFSASHHDGRIGSVKRNGFGLARGQFIVELDHDDYLRPEALQHVVTAFQKYPDVGFVYSDWAECAADTNAPVIYPAGWGHGYGSYRQQKVGDITYHVANAPNINPKTIRHIVAAPNHLRAWRASTYFEVGGHNPEIGVADDYELMVRTFLTTRMARIPHFDYIQYRVQGGNTHQHRNQEIQRMVRWLSNYYDKAIHERFVELGVDDFVYQAPPALSSFFRLDVSVLPNPAAEPHCTILAEV